MQVVPAEISSLCSSGYSPLVLSGVMLWLAREHFGDENNIEAESLKKRVWVDDPKSTSTIWINLVGLWNARVVNRRPAAVIKRNDIASQRVTIGDASHGGIELPEGGDHYLRQNIGSHTIFCLSEHDGEAELIGSELFRCFSEWAPLLRRELNLQRFEATHMGAIGRLKESKEHFVVPVQLGWSYMSAWQLKVESPVLAQLHIDMNLSNWKEE